MIYTITLNPALDRTLFVEGMNVNGTSRIKREARYAGGKGIDVSRALVEMDVPTVAMGLVGGFDGKEFEGRLLNEGVACDFTRIAGEIRTNIIIHDESTGRESALLARGPEVQPVEIMDFVSRLEKLRAVDFLVISGSLPPGVSPAVYRRIVQVATDNDIRVLLDASGAALRHGIRSGPTVIKPNRTELAELVGKELEEPTAIVEACRELLERVRIVLVSLGADGMVMLDAERALHARPPRVEVKSTVGAGDCAVAGFLHGMVTSEDPVDCLRRAVASGTAATLNEGTGLCRCEDIDRLLPEVEVKEVAS